MPMSCSICEMVEQAWYEAVYSGSFMQMSRVMDAARAHRTLHPDHDPKTPMDIVGMPEGCRCAGRCACGIRCNYIAVKDGLCEFKDHRCVVHSTTFPGVK